MPIGATRNVTAPGARAVTYRPRSRATPARQWGVE